MPTDLSLAPLPPDRFGPAQAWHLLQRAGFGADARSLDRAVADGLDATVERLVRYHAIDHDPPPPDVGPDARRPLTREQRRELAMARRNDEQDVLERYRERRNEANRADRAMFAELQGWWFRRMCDTPRPLEEKLTLMWHDHFATSQRSVRDAYLLYRQNQTLRSEACGNFAELALGIVRDPAMLKYLNNDRNRKQNPNENLAREFMELFTLGEGNYTERDIAEAARALTGYTYDDNDFVFRARHHDDGVKRILGMEHPFDGESFVRRLLVQRACSQFVALKLYRCLADDVSDDPDEVPRPARHVINRLADILRDHRYDLAPAVRTLLKSRHFYDPAMIGRKVKSPVHFAVGTMRTLNNPDRKLGPIRWMLAAAGQELFAPPSVDGWTGGRAWINTSTLFLRQNLAAYLVTGRRRGGADFDRPGDDPVALAGDLQNPTPTRYADRMIDLMLGPHVDGPARLAVLDAAARARTLDRRTAGAILLLITAAPEYQLC